MELPEFRIAKYPITYRQWRDFLEATSYDWQGKWYAVVVGWRGTFQRAYAPTSSYPDDHHNLP